MKKSVLAALAVSFAAFLAIPAAADTETFTTSDGVLSIDLPSENWKQMEDPSKWVALSDGGNLLTIDHLSNGEKLPDMTVADDHYVNVYQAVFSTQNEVFIITGSVVDSEDIPEVANMIMSAKVLKYDTKTAIRKEDAPTVSEFSVVPTDKTMYVTADGLNVRTGCSTDDQIIGGFGYGASVHVTGVVQRNGADYGWSQVAYENGTGYVSSNFLSATEPAPKQNTSNTNNSGNSGNSKTPNAGANYTGSAKSVYREDGSTLTIYECLDGYWRDKSGNAYSRITEYEFAATQSDVHLYTYDYTQITNDYNPADYTVTAYDEMGTAYVLTMGQDGFYYDSNGTAYIRHAYNDFQVYEGNMHLTVY